MAFELKTDFEKGMMSITLNIILVAAACVAAGVLYLVAPNSPVTQEAEQVAEKLVEQEAEQVLHVDPTAVTTLVNEICPPQPLDSESSSGASPNSGAVKKR